MTVAAIRIALLLVTLALCAAYYLPALDQFFSQEDFPLLVTSHPGWVPAHRFWFFGSDREYRPLTQHFYFYMNQLLFGLNSRAHHAMNLAVHLGSVTLVYFLGRRWLRTVAAALFSAVFYGFHSVHFYEIYWVSGISQLGFVFFALLSIFAFLKFKDSSNGWYWALALMAATAAFLSKEDAVVLPLLISLMLWERSEDQNLPAWLGVLSVWGLLPGYLIWRVLILGYRLGSSGLYRFGGGLNHIPEKLVDYGRWLLTGKLGLIAVLLLVAVLALELIERRAGPGDVTRAGREPALRRFPLFRRVVFLALLTALPMIPSLWIPSASEHYLNLSAVGLGLLLATAIETATAFKQAFLFPAVACFFLLGFSVKTHEHMINGGWAVPVPAKAKACRELFEQIEQAPIPQTCDVVLLYPPIDAWEKDWLMFLPKLAQSRMDLQVRVIAPRETAALLPACHYVWQWKNNGWKQERRR